MRATRYPVLWERVAPRHPRARDYRWAARRLAALADRGVEPIVTLLHHGSGPAYTSLVDPAFPHLFAEYAAATARRFPWVKRWTPINEPLTTARFSTLYAAWYPNAFFDDAAFGRAIVNEALAIAYAAERIRDVVPDARFLLTEDLQSFTAADAGVEDYVAHKRERTFLSCELLQGRIVDGHPMHRYLVERCQVDAALLRRLERRPQPPDVMGWNYYPNSERWLESDGKAAIATSAWWTWRPNGWICARCCVPRTPAWAYRSRFRRYTSTATSGSARAGCCSVSTTFARWRPAAFP